MFRIHISSTYIFSDHVTGRKRACGWEGSRFWTLATGNSNYWSDTGAATNLIFPGFPVLFSNTPQQHQRLFSHSLLKHSTTSQRLRLKRGMEDITMKNQMYSHLLLFFGGCLETQVQRGHMIPLSF